LKKLSGEDRQNNDKVEQALSYFDDLRVEKEEEVAELQLRRNPERYYEICREFMPDIVGRVRFKKGIAAKTFMEVVERSDEALALVCIDNVLDLCRERARADCPDIGVGAISKKSTKYTGGPDKRWSEEGYWRFNILMNAVGVDRKERGSQFDKQYEKWDQERKEATYNNKQGSTGRATTKVGNENVRALNDFDDIMSIEV